MPKTVSVATVSKTRLRLVQPSEAISMKLGTRIEGDLNFLWGSHHLVATLTQLTDTAFDFTIEGSVSKLREGFSTFQNSLQRYFGEDPMSSQWFEVPPENLKQDDGNRLHVLRATDPQVELAVTLDSGNQVVSFQMSFKDHYVEGGAKATPRVGKLDAEPVRETAHYKSSMLVRWQSAPSKEIQQEAARYILSVPHLVYQQRTRLAAMLYEKTV